MSTPKTLHPSLALNRLAPRVAVTRSFQQKPKRQVFYDADDGNSDDDDDCDGVDVMLQRGQEKSS